jgi:hypothetical protein
LYSREYPDVRTVYVYIFDYSIRIFLICKSTLNVIITDAEPTTSTFDNFNDGNMHITKDDDSKIDLTAQCTDDVLHYALQNSKVSTIK